MTLDGPHGAGRGKVAMSEQSPIDPAVLAAIDPAVLAAALDAARERQNVERQRADASSAVERAVVETVERLASLAAGAAASGLDAPDLAAILASAVERAVPADPTAVAAVIAPDPAPVGPRRTRSRVERVWSRVESGSIWNATLAGSTGRVMVTLDGNGVPSFRATTGARGTYRSPSRAVQAACGNPAGAGRRGEATVNGFLALTADASSASVERGQTLDAATTA